MMYLILFCIFCFKQIVIVLSLLPLKVYLKFAEKSFRNKENNTHTIVVGSVSSNGSLRMIVSRYLQGYIRFFIIQIGFIPSHFIRNIIYTYILGVKLAPKSIIYYGSEIRSPYNLFIGEGSIIGDKSVLDARNKIIIGKNVNFSSFVSIWTEQHDYNDPYFECNSAKTGPVVIEDKAWIGPNVTILPNIIIGEGAVVAAGSVVTKNVQAFALVGGVPAKKIGDRRNDLSYEFDGKAIPFY